MNTKMSTLEFEDISNGDIIRAAYGHKDVIFMVYKATNDIMYGVKVYLDSDEAVICNIKNSLQKGQFENARVLTNIFDL